MHITPERLKEFQEAYKLDFGDEITEGQAREMLFRVVTLYEQLLKALPSEQKEEGASEVTASRDASSDAEQIAP